MWNYKKISKLILAFTLAEVLITLGIIGVVATMTIPALIKNTQDSELKTAWKKAFSIFSQAYYQAAADYNIDFTSNSTLMDSLTPYFKVITQCTPLAGSTCWHANGIVKTLPLTDGTQYNFPNYSATVPGFITVDGMKLIINSDGAVNDTGWVMIDVNADKNPNIAGKDIFAIRFYGTKNNNKVIPFNETNYGKCSPVAVAAYGQTLTGLGCSEYYIKNY